jgi:hypothetical protein
MENKPVICPFTGEECKNHEWVLWKRNLEKVLELYHPRGSGQFPELALVCIGPCRDVPQGRSNSISDKEDNKTSPDPQV